MINELSPEDRLLRLIKGKKAVQPQEAKSDEVIPVNHSDNGALALSLFRRLRFSFKIQKIIFLIFGIACLYLFVSFVYSWIFLKQANLLKDDSNDASYKIADDFEVKPYEFYSQALNNRQIFNPMPAEQKAPQEPLDSDNRELLNDISLLGIIAGEKSQAIIEDKKNQKTYYLSKGEFLGIFQVEDIRDGKVILNCRGEKLELYL